jgi:ferredoxin
MIIYFSGTGNSLWVAKELSKTFDEKLISIADELKNKKDFSYKLQDEEKIFFVFPVHSWGPAVLVLEFIKKLTFENYYSQAVYLVCTCGDMCGDTDKIIEHALAKRNIRLTKSFSVQMPNNYILMKGFGIDSKEIEQEKLKKAPLLLNEIVENIKTHSSKELYTRGGVPFLKSRIVYPLFKNYAIGKNSFFATDACVSCGLCVEICPTNTIFMEDGKPKWRNNCVQCTACIHRCPSRAIEFGNITQNQGRYYNPNV